jgi:ribosomal protein L24E
MCRKLPENNSKTIQEIGGKSAKIYEQNKQKKNVKWVKNWREMDEEKLNWMDELIRRDE